MSKSGLSGNGPQTQTAPSASRSCAICSLANDARVTILDVGAGYGPVSKFILDQFANATCIAQDGSPPMLQRGQDYGQLRHALSSLPVRSVRQRSLPQQFGPFDAAVSAICLHNLRDFQRISEIHGDIRTHLKPGGIFLNLDLVNAPTLRCSSITSG